jgi:ferredoxin
MPHDAHRELCARMMVPGSDRLARIWEFVADETDARLLLASPGTIGALAAGTGIAADDAERRLAGLFHRGAAFVAEKGGERVYRAARHLVQLHDGTAQWPEAPAAFLDLWRAFMHEEYPDLVRTLLAAGFPAFMRVVPALQALESLPDHLPSENIETMLRGADVLAVCPCPCRRVERNCDSPSETCIQIGKGARYAIARGTGRPLTADEAVALARDAEKAGLVHCVDNHAATGTFLCNCCADCCAILVPHRQAEGCREILAPGRYRARVVHDLCTADGVCEDVCPVGAIAIDKRSAVAAVDAEKCVGCGLCVAGCGFGALSLVAARPPEFIPA